MQLQTAGKSDVGQIREINEDHWISDVPLGLYVVCDGMGGHESGEVASRLAAETVRELVAAAPHSSDPDTLIALMRSAVTEANRRVHAEGGNRSSRGMGTTCTALLVRGHVGVMAHVGDSRLYVKRAGAVHQLSEDHTFVAEAVKQGIIKPGDAAHSAHSNIVTRAVGPHAEVLVDTLAIEFLPGDTVLLCSDGLHQYFEDLSELGQRLELENLEPLAEGLVATANERGGSDNITALVIRISGRKSRRADEVTATFTTVTHVDLFTELTMPEVNRVMHHLESSKPDEGEVIFRQGDVSDGLFILVSGEARVSRDGREIATLSAGAHFGEMALLNQRPRSATLTAGLGCRVLHLSRAAFYGLVQQDTVIGVKFLWKLAQTLSLRLDDVYTTPEEIAHARTTLSFGLFPSPFYDKK